MKPVIAGTTTKTEAIEALDTIDNDDGTAAEDDRAMALLRDYLWHSQPIAEGGLADLGTAEHDMYGD